MPPSQMSTIEVNRIDPEYCRKAYKVAARACMKMDMNSRFVDLEKESAIPTFDIQELHLGALLASGTFNHVYELDRIELSQEPPVRGKSRDNERRRQTLAQTTKNLSHLVVKFLRKEVMYEGSSFCQGANNIIKEQKFLASLAHPNIIRLHGLASVGAEGFSKGVEGKFFLIVDNITVPFTQRFREWRNEVQEVIKTPKRKGFQKLIIDRKKEQDAAQAVHKELFLKRLQVAADISSALTYLHDLNIVFRDINPRTLGFDCQGKIKLMDFAIAKELRNGQSRMDSITPSRRKDPYLAPEVTLSRPYDPSADVYSFGIMAWQICSLGTPFRDMSPEDFMNNVVNGKERPPVKDSWSVAFTNALKWSWVQEPSVRPPMKEIHRVLQREVNIRPITSQGFGALSTTDSDRMVVSSFRRVESSEALLQSSGDHSLPNQLSSRSGRSSRQQRRRSMGSLSENARSDKGRRTMEIINRDLLQSASEQTWPSEIPRHMDRRPLDDNDPLADNEQLRKSNHLPGWMDINVASNEPHPSPGVPRRRTMSHLNEYVHRDNDHRESYGQYNNSTMEIQNRDLLQSASDHSLPNQISIRNGRSSRQQRRRSMGSLNENAPSNKGCREPNGQYSNSSTEIKNRDRLQSASDHAGPSEIPRQMDRRPLLPDDNKQLCKSEHIPGDIIVASTVPHPSSRRPRRQSMGSRNENAHGDKGHREPQGQYSNSSLEMKLRDINLASNVPQTGLSRRRSMDDLNEKVSRDKGYREPHGQYSNISMETNDRRHDSTARPKARSEQHGASNSRTQRRPSMENSQQRNYGTEHVSSRGRRPSMENGSGVRRTSMEHVSSRGRRPSMENTSVVRRTSMEHGVSHGRRPSMENMSGVRRPSV